MKRLVVIIGLVVFLVSNVTTQDKTNCENFVPDEATAIKIAEAVWLPIFGKAIYRKKPFVAKLVSDDVWHVTGTLKTHKGGVPYLEIRKCDGKLLKVTHSK